MILVGQYDSPFVRRVAVALNILSLKYEHRPLSAFGDGGRLAALNPLQRVPTLVLDDGDVLIDSAAILDHLDEIAGKSRLIAPSGPARRTMLRVCALATGLCDMMASLLYERLLHDKPSVVLVSRRSAQIQAALAALEAMRAECPTEFWFGATPGHPDIAAACALRFLAEAHPALHDATAWPHLAAHAATCEAMPAFSAVVQPFSPPGRAPRRPAASGTTLA